MHKGRALALVAMSALAVVVSGTVAGAAIQPIKRYAVPLPGSGYETTRLLSVGDTVPMTGNPSKQFQMVGIPDGTGAHRNPDGTRTIYVNHELPVSPAVATTQPILGDPLNRGAIVAKLVVGRRGNVLSGDRAYDVVYDESQATPVAQPAPDAGNTTRPFSRFCSATLVGPEEGFDRFIYMPNEEEGTEANTFDQKGGVAVAIFDNELHTLPKMGRFAWENTVPQPNRGSRTVVMGLEDGPFAVNPSVENSQLYMYVGTKERGAGVSVLNRNGLDNGLLYVLAPVNPAQASEASFGDEDGAIPVQWKLVPNADSTTETQLEAASDAAGAITFARPEDGAFNKKNKNQFFFVTTGGLAGANELGRLYSVRINPSDPTAQGTLRVVYEADEVIAAGRDIAISPDNIDTSDKYLMINEDGTTESRLVMAAKGRDGSIWRFKVNGGSGGIDVGSAKRIAELDPPGRDGIAVGPGVWETSGVTDTSELFGGGSWIFDVQAHPPTTAPGVNTWEDGQLLLLTPADDDEGDEDEGDQDDD